jgi:hypothetical protein
MSESRRIWVHQLEKKVILMGQYMVNGEVVDLREDPPTAAALKRAAGSPTGDWVMATMSGGRIVKLHDTERIPVQYEDLSIVPAFQYGR